MYIVILFDLDGKTYLDLDLGEIKHAFDIDSALFFSKNDFSILLYGSVFLSLFCLSSQINEQKWFHCKGIKVLSQLHLEIDFREKSM